MEEPMNKRKLPKTDSVQKLAKFWDSHDLTDFEKQLEEVEEPVFVKGIPIEVRLQSREAETVMQIAKARGVSQEELIREWILPHLSHRNGRGSKKKQAAASRPRRKRS